MSDLHNKIETFYKKEGDVLKKALEVIINVIQTGFH
jgi:hypothetical protein